MTVRYDPVGECIYCGTREGKLSREHIVAHGLNGDLILPEASCKACATITGKIEQYNLREMFGSFRHKHEMNTRRSGKDRPTAWKAIARPKGGEPRAVSVPLPEFPLALFFPVYPPAKFLRGEPDDGAPTRADWWTCTDTEKLSALARKVDMEEGHFHLGNVNPTKFSQMLAKIAHGYAVSKFGVHGFTHDAVDLILDRSQSANYLVGCWPEAFWAQRDDCLHQITHWTHPSGLLLVDIRLFGIFGSPRYHVVTGTLKG